MFSSRLRNNLEREQHLQRVESVIDELGLQNCADTMIGNVLFKGISGGERKRTSIGVDIITDPQVILMDEPTSGLDSWAALRLVKTLKKMASHGKTIVATIHMPGSQMFALFDKILLLAEGKQAFFGTRNESISTFMNAGFHIPVYANPADIYLRVVGTRELGKLLDF